MESPILKLPPIPEIHKLVEIINSLPDDAKILELGTFLGRTAHAMATTRKDIFVTTIDNNQCPQWTEQTYSENDVKEFLGSCLNIKYMVIDMFDYIKAANENFDLIFIDAAKDYNGVFTCLEKYKHLVNERGYIVCHDYTLDDQVKEAIDDSFLFDDNYDLQFLTGSLIAFRKR